MNLLPPVRHRPLSRAVVLLALLALPAVGCGPSDEIRTYTVPRSTAPSAPAVPPPVVSKPPAEGAKVRLLGAIIPIGKFSRFVKFTGPEAKIDQYEKAFDAFVQSIRVPADPETPLTYTDPEGAKPGPQRQMRQVTFQFGPPGNTVDLYVSDPFGGSLLENVNRWRKEVSLPEVTEAELPKAVIELNLGGVKAYKVDMRGVAGKGGMMPPFAGKR